MRLQPCWQNLPLAELMPPPPPPGASDQLLAALLPSLKLQQSQLLEQADWPQSMGVIDEINTVRPFKLYALAPQLNGLWQNPIGKVFLEILSSVQDILWFSLHMCS